MVWSALELSNLSGEAIVLSAPNPKNMRPSPFVVRCLEARLPEPHEVAADVACGYGRHLRPLKRLGYSVVGVDLNEVALRFIKRRQPRTMLVRADIRAGLPIKARSLGLAVVVQYPLLDVIPLLAAALIPGGYAILESIGGQGRNWQVLSKKGALRRRLKRTFEILELHEHSVGPLDSGAVVARAFVRRK